MSHAALPKWGDMFNGARSADDIRGFGKDGARGGNVEFEWKVEEGESSGVVFGLKTETRDATGGTHHASVTDLIIDPYTQGRLVLGSDQGSSMNGFGSLRAMVRP